MKKHHNQNSWQKVALWYQRITERGQGHYFHQHIIVPGVLRLLGLDSSSPSSNPKVLDLACGNGVLAKSIPKTVKYVGIDISESLIKFARNGNKNPNHKFFIGDITKPLNIPEASTRNHFDFTHAVIILALQNIENPKAVLTNAARHLTSGGKLIIVLNHPAFRIPRQSSWGIDEDRKIQYRRVDKYMSPMRIPINMNPSNPRGQMTMSYHFPISAYSRMLKESGFTIELIEEWTSDKKSQGKAAKMENRARSEIPLFMAISAIKK
jgi:SAM-dependent methyltransferase